MSNFNLNSMWPSIIAIVSILTTGATSLYSTHENSNAQEKIKMIEAKIELEKINTNTIQQNKEQIYESKKNECEQLRSAAKSLAFSVGKVYREFDAHKQAEIDSNIWAATTLLSAKHQKEFLEMYYQGPKEQDKDQKAFIWNLASITLKNIMFESQKCIEP